MKKKEVNLPMFRRIIILMEGTPEEVTKKSASIAKKYGLEATEKNLTKSAGLCYSYPADKSEKQEVEVRPIFIFINEESLSKFSEELRPKQRIIAITHEIRHAVDRIIEGLGIQDHETSAYLTGYLCGEFLAD